MSSKCYICGYSNGSLDTTKPELCEECVDELGRSEFTVCKKIRLEIAHKIPGHKTCGKIHGHSTNIVVGIKGRMDIQTGMAIDFKEIKEILKDTVVDAFDHTCLNDFMPIPTAEFLAYYIYKALENLYLNVAFVRVHETENNYIEYGGPDV